MIAAADSAWVVEASAWLALLLYPFGLRGAGRSLSEPAVRRARLLFSFGGLVFLLHVVTAIWIHHGMSHSVAFEYTARRTEQLTGIASGFGLYLNYLFAVLWCAEIVWWHSAVVSYRSRATAISAGIHGFFLFMIANGAVVFVPWPRRALGILVLVLCGLALWLRSRSAISDS